jgi:ribosomal protein L37AE/L43A
MKLPLVENTPYIDIQEFKSLKSGRYESTLKGFKDVLIVNDDKYTIGNQTLHTATTKVGYGKRTWFVCPSCGRNAKRLYLIDVWKCRECHHLIYHKSRLSGNEFKYVMERIRRIQSQFDMTYSYSYLGLTDCEIEKVPLFKPKHMRQEKFDALRFELEWLINKRCELWLAMVK